MERERERERGVCVYIHTYISLLLVTISMASTAWNATGSRQVNLHTESGREIQRRRGRQESEWDGGRGVGEGRGSEGRSEGANEVKGALCA